MPSGKPSTESTATFRHSPYTYLHLSLLILPNTNPLSHQSTQSSSNTPLDDITALSHLTAALQQSLGLTGTAIPIDILKIENQDVWIRVPYDDGSAVMAAVSQWSSPAKGVGWRVRGRSVWLGGLVGREDGRLWSLER